VFEQSPQSRSLLEKADQIRDSIAEFRAEKATAPSQDELSKIDKHIQMLIELETWFRTRNGYDGPPPTS
jgi:hypothetical protein